MRRAGLPQSGQKWLVICFPLSAVLEMSLVVPVCLVFGQHVRVEEGLRWVGAGVPVTLKFSDGTTICSQGVSGWC